MLAALASQAAYGLALAFGLKPSPRLLERVADAMVATLHEYGALGLDASDMVAGPTLDRDTLRHVQERAFTRQAARAARDTPYYRDLFGRLGMDPGRPGQIAAADIPLTPKRVLRADPGAFVAARAVPQFAAQTTGTTGRPTRVLFSAYEMRTFAALAAVGALADGTVRPDDAVAVLTSARSALGNTVFAGACGRIGALCIPVGQVEPLAALEMLTSPVAAPNKNRRISVLSVYPSYLGELVQRGLDLGLRPADFGVERVVVGGEVVTAGLLARARTLFGPARFCISYGMTETYPCCGAFCSEGHAHFDPAHGRVEVVNHETGEPTPAGEVGSLVVTPLAPLRETTLLLRYDTGDLVRALDPDPGCSLRFLPGVASLEGKRDLAVRGPAGWVTPRAVLEAAEADEAVRLPARVGLSLEEDGAVVQVAAPGAGASARARIEERLAAGGTVVRAVRLVNDPSELSRPLPLRSDLRDGRALGASWGVGTGQRAAAVGRS